MDWTAGYVTDIDYTHGYYREIGPCMMDFVLLLRGYEPPRRPQMRYLELGFGQGLSANVHAAAVPGSYFGTDFNPVHAANAQALARVSQAPAEFFDDSFEELLARSDLPDFDYITLHGIWSWVNDKDRTAIVEIIRRHLKVGGAVYMSYNTQPGWATAMPLRHLMTLHAETAGSDAQGPVNRINEAIAFGKQLADANARYFVANPSTKDRLDKIGTQNRNYLAHEYFNREWLPMYFSEVNAWLGEGKLSFASPASALDLVDHINLPPAQRAILDRITLVALKESVRDYLLNTQFRRDIFTRGAGRLTPFERLERLKNVQILLNAPYGRDFEYDVSAGSGKVTLKKEIYAPILEELAARDYAPKRIGDLATKLEIANFDQLIEVITILVGSGKASPIQPAADIEAAAPRCRRLNAQLVERAYSRGDITYLASPVTGEGVQVSRFEQMFLSARARGLKTPSKWAHDAWSKLKELRQSLIKDGKVLEGDEDNLAELTRQANVLAEKRLPVLKVLQVAE